jgi:hypothetical protein
LILGPIGAGRRARATGYCLLRGYGEAWALAREGCVPGRARAH